MDKATIRAMVERQARAWEQMDYDTIAADFAPDGWFISPGGRWQGPIAIRQAAESFFKVSKDVKIEIKRVLVDGNEGAVEWIWSEMRRADERVLTAEDSIIFELLDGQIVYWREYFDTAEMM